ncbi:hypothetical protein MNBD_GAMMA07-188 [hydrothermal vent metagenome]|uniref:Alpha 1,4-glycosyltransferase domain-containing protein n=1 Tax=hydrothermal vent metagenome TaxID=652676 RepID=A0A3B0XKL9_9ZZZZ
MLPKLNTLWIEGALSNLERICLASMLKQGHEVTLHTYGEVTNIPEGVIVKSGQDTLPYNDSFRYKRNNSIALFSDYFRCMLLKKEMGLWVDLDCFLLKPYVLPPHGYLLGHEMNTINSSVLHLPNDCEILQDIITACENPNESPYWLDFRKAYLKRAAYALSGKKWHLGEMGWGVVGPVALTKLIPHYNLLDKVQPMKAFYPLNREGTAKLYNPEPFDHIVNDPDITSIHVYAKEKKQEAPVSGSFIEYATNSVSAYL